jgi:hypothetical protein
MVAAHRRNYAAIDAVDRGRRARPKVVAHPVRFAAIGAAHQDNRVPQTAAAQPARSAEIDVVQRVNYVHLRVAARSARAAPATAARREQPAVARLPRYGREAAAKVVTHAAAQGAANREKSVVAEEEAVVL